MAALARRGLKVAPFKVGPDFIDPGHHSAVTGITSRNLDGWMLSKEKNLACVRNHARSSDIAVIEGVMGLFDGYDGKSEAGSTAQMAKWLGFPVILAASAKSMARSAAAVVKGFEIFDKDLKFAGVIFNHVGSPRHKEYLKEALVGHVDMKLIGAIPKDEKIAIPERHLGLVTRQDHPLSVEDIDRLADMIEDNIDLDAVLDNLPENDLHEGKNFCPQISENENADEKIRIGVAKDRAFCFYYQDNLDMIEKAGAQLIPFSPIDDLNLPKNLDGLYIGGGYPEIYADKLAQNENIRNQIKEKSLAGMPIYGECGGFMYLCEKIIDKKDNTYQMTGCFPFQTAMSSRLKALGYREITFLHDNILGLSGQSLRGHEFHYSDMTRLDMPRPGDKNGVSEIENIYNVAARSKNTHEIEGYRIERTLGSYIHLHFGSLPGAALHFVETCNMYHSEKIAEF